MSTVISTRPTGVSVEDVQARADHRRIPINQVGIKDIRHPVKVKDRSNGEQHTIATFNMYVNLPHDFKGTHMSRFVEILHHEREISVDSFRSMLVEMRERLDADAGHIEMSFPFFIIAMDRSRFASMITRRSSTARRTASQRRSAAI